MQSTSHVFSFHRRKHDPDRPSNHGTQILPESGQEVLERETSTLQGGRCPGKVDGGESLRPGGHTEQLLRLQVFGRQGFFTSRARNRRCIAHAGAEWYMLTRHRRLKGPTCTAFGHRAFRKMGRTWKMGRRKTNSGGWRGSTHWARRTHPPKVRIASLSQRLS